MHTSWCWAVRNQDGERQRSYEFEGVVLTLTAYAEITWENDDDDVKQTGPIIGNESNTETQVADLFEHVEQHINDSRDEAEGIAQQREEPPKEGQAFTIWRPQEPQWQAC